MYIEYFYVQACSVRKLVSKELYTRSLVCSTLPIQFDRYTDH